MKRAARAIPLVLGVLVLVFAVVGKLAVDADLVDIDGHEAWVTVSDGTGRVTDPATLQTSALLPLVATRTVTGLPQASTSNVTVLTSVSCLRTAVSGGPEPDAYGCVEPGDPSQLQRTSDRFAVDNKSALAPPDEAKYGVTSAHSGLTFIFPMSTKKTSYSYFDTIAGKASPLVYTGTTTEDGLRVYTFHQQVTDPSITIQGMSQGSYTGVRTLWVEPESGLIIDDQESVTEQLTDGPVVYSADLRFTAETVEANIGAARKEMSSLDKSRIWGPLAILVVGLVLLGAGIVVWRRGGRDRRDRHPDPTQPRVPDRAGGRGPASVPPSPHG